MTQNWRLPATLLLSLVLGAPALHDLVTDPGRLTSTAPRYAAAVVVAWLGVTLLSRLVARFWLHNALLAHQEHQAARAAELAADRQGERTPPATVS